MFKQGFFTSLANPFAVAFFAALFPQFIDTNEAIMPQLLVLGITYVLVDGVILLAWGLAGVHVSKKIHLVQFSMINKICGVLMFAAAGLLALKDFETSTS